MMRLYGLVVLAVLGIVAIGDAHATTVIDKGVAALRTGVNCGAHAGVIEVFTGVRFADSETAVYQSGISIGFRASSGDAVDCCWVQFFAVQVVATIRTGTKTLSGYVPGSYSSVGGVVTFSAPARPGGPVVRVWNADSLAKHSPCYEAGGSSHFKDSTTAVIFDSPSSVAGAMAPAVSVPPGWSLAKVESLTEFEAYFVCNRRVCAVVRWAQYWSWQPNSSGPPTLTGPIFTPAPSAGSASALRPEQSLAAKQKYPGQTILPP